MMQNEENCFYHAANSGCNSDSWIHYTQKNRLYVLEWNQRYMTSRNNGLYDTYIDYNSNTDYGLDLNYKLYYYFKYFEVTNHIKLINSSW